MRFRLIVNGKALDLTEGQSLTFKFVNDVFGFDNIELSRTAEFSVPATSNNQIIFDFASRTDYEGGAMRLYNDCLLQYAGGEIHGKLAVTAWEGGAYKCSFIYGEMVALTSIKKAGKIGEYLNFPSTDNVTLSETPTPVYYTYNLNFPEYDNGLGASITDMRLPGVKIDYLLAACASYFGVTCNLTDPMLRIVANTLNAEDFVISTSTMTITAGGAPTVSGADPNYFQSVTILYGEMTYGFSINAYKCIKPCKLNIQGSNPQTAGYPADSNYTFIKRGLYQLRIESGTGEGLDRIMSSLVREIYDTTINAKLELQEGDFFFIADYCRYNPNWQFNKNVIRGTWALTSLSFSLDLLGASNTTTEGGIWYLQPNLPDVTFLDLLKTVAQANCMALVYDEATKTFDGFGYNFDAKGAKVLRLEDMLIKIKRMERKFIDWAQSNSIIFTNNDFVNDADRARAERYYMVANEILADEKKVFVFPFSQGSQTTFNNTLTERAVAKIDCVEVDENGAKKFKAPSKPTLVRTILYQSGVDFATMAPIVKPNAYLQQMCSISTQIMAEVYVSEIEFLNFQRYSRFTYNGGWWCLIEAEWSNGVATLTLQRYR